MSYSPWFNITLCNIGGIAAAPQTYPEQIQAISDLIYYLTMTDAAGTTTLSNAAPAKPAYQAACTNVTFGATAGPIEDETAADVTGNGTINLLTAGTFGADFNGNEYTISMWLKATEAVWADSTYRFPLGFQASTSTNLVYARKQNTAYGQLNFVGRNNNTTLLIPSDIMSSPAWFHVLIKNSDSGDKFVAKIDNVLQLMLTGVGTWPAETPLVNAWLCANTTGGASWKGSLAHFAVINRFTTDAEDVILSRSPDTATVDAAVATISDGVWTWFNNPRAVRSGSKTFIGSLTKTGVVQVSEYNHTAGTLTGPTTLKTLAEIDDHDNPSILIRDSDSRLLLSYAVHNTKGLWQRLSTNPLDSTAFGAEADLDTAFGNSFYAYPCPVQLTGEVNDPIHLFFRSYAGDSNPYYSKSEDGGATWAADVVLVDNPGERPYFHVAQNGDGRVDICMTDGHPNEVVTNSVYHFYYEAGNFYQSDGTLIGAVGDLPMTLAQLTLVYDGTTIRAWVHDIAIDENGYPVIVYAIFPAAASDHRYRYARWNGATWDDNEICTAGKPLYAVEAYYSGGVALDHENPNIIYASRELGSGIHRLWKGVTADGGATWALTRLSNEFAMRPVVVRGHSGNPNLLYLTGVYTTYNNYNTSVKLRNG